MYHFGDFGLRGDMDLGTPTQKSTLGLPLVFPQVIVNPSLNLVACFHWF